MRSEFSVVDGRSPAPPPRPGNAVAQGARANKPKPRITRSRIAKPLLTSMGTATLLAAGSFVVLAVSSTGSARPWDWTRMDPSAAIDRYQLCGRQGPGAIGCMLSAGFKPASAESGGAAPGGAHRTQQPLFSIATVQDPASPAASGSSRRAGASRPSGSNAVEPQETVKPAASTPAPNAATCQAAMTAAQAQGPAAVQQVRDECEAATPQGSSPSHDE